MKKFLSEFKDFISRGNVVDLAIGVIIGSAFTAVVKSFTTNLVNPILGLVTGRGTDLSELKLKVTDNLVFNYGAFLNDLINFILIALVVFVMVKLINKYLIKPKKVDKGPDPQLVVLEEIRDLLSKNK
ncbi:large-conductance mechanosensitive channel protein MscL [Convivina praedatoris]|uniref:Large-conductance mechanosensitive channel n=1 Tax=Convivina praedatoris TaxID=2880963 RepID=A0ABM9D4L4_9LACO|nr:large-conductance mechanosensitive channel protein MscL [Convivina sp. LMG 32447]CAH1853367.1 Large-conductance mechanosensitive channel [Convivina sp. LMG 32447]CAH1854736.1 Large-conductance mechanosensitive channel [Convivina sp. LMG 32447]